MIIVLAATGRHKSLERIAGRTDAPEMRVMSFDQAFAEARLPFGAYIFIPDHLSRRQLKDAGRLAKRLQETGCRVLNDPAKWRPRFDFLRTLHRMGINPFNIYWADEYLDVKRFPVFLRTDDHGGRLSGLISDLPGLERAIEAAVCAGVPRSILMIVEYAAEPANAGTFRRLALTRVGRRFFQDGCVHEFDWFVSRGQQGAAEELYDDELRMMQESSYAEELAPVFDIAGVDYGRLDFGLVGKKPCIYEINAGPNFYTGRSQPTPQRQEGFAIWLDRFIDALREIDLQPGEADEAAVEAQGASIQALQQARRLYPESPTIDLNLSREFERRNDIRSAISSMEDVVGAAPRSTRFLRRLCRLRAANGDLDGALTAIESAVAISEKDWASHNEHSRVLNLLHRNEDAAAAAERACALAPDQWRPHLQLAKAYASSGAFTAAVEACRRAVSCAPQKPALRESISRFEKTVASGAALETSRAFEREGKLNQAIRCIEDALRDDDLASPNILKRLCHLCIASRQVEKALGAIDRAIALDENDWESHYQCSRVLFLLRRDQDAVEAAERACDLAPDRWQAHHQRARAYAKIKANAAALEACDRAASLAPADPKIAENIDGLQRSLVAGRGGALARLVAGRSGAIARFFVKRPAKGLAERF